MSTTLEQPSTGSQRRRTALVVDDDEMVVELVRAGLEAQGIDVVTAEDGYAALERLSAAVPDVIVSDVNMPGMDGFTLVSRLRAEPATRSVPLVFLTSRGEQADVLQGLRLGADDYVRKPFDLGEVVARVVAKLDRPSVPVERLVHDPRTGLLTGAQLAGEARREAARAAATGRDGGLVVVELAERDVVRDRYGVRGDDELAAQVGAMLRSGAGALDVVGRDGEGRFLLLLPETPLDEVEPRLRELSAQIVRTRWVVAGERVAITPVVGWLAFSDAASVMRPARGTSAQRAGDAADVVDAALVEAAALAADAASLHLDLLPVRWTPELAGQVRRSRRRARAPWSARLRTPLQIALTVLLGIVVPFFVYLGLYRAGLDIGGIAYLVVVAALLVTAASIWVEGLLALDPEQPPEEQPDQVFPPASAIIAAYLPNEAATVVETVEAFLRQDYPGELQVILAYNTPRPLPVQETLAELARKDPRFLPLNVEGSTSKAQNVNAALAHVTGEFTGVFDADHHPDRHAFRRAWRWLGNGYSVVQGHCVVRNGDASWVARTVAVEFESIYAVSHPGRARLHRFGIFGGSNGYWRTEVLRRIRMHGRMLTEDIDSSLRVVEEGGRIANDPGLLSRELAPTTLAQLWNQRMRWAQGWFQVSMRHLEPAWRSSALTLRQKLGMTFLLGWREIYPWISLQMFPVVAFLAYKAGGVNKLDWLVPLFVLTSVFTLSVGPGQVVFARRLAAPDIRRQRGWFLRYLLISSFFYTEYKNVIARVSQLKEFSGEREWKVTPRSAPTRDSVSSGEPAS
jgi:DNA-binding response OmpR family regulator/cellulose synthase/poly-beta-1,6-N-acetylglucosamine synthase-like glycosyltransferase